jgi:hypothetical protein
MADEFGLTNDEQEINEVSAFREAAIADGWEAQPGSAAELIEDYAHLSKEGFKMHTMSRRLVNSKFKFQASVHIWGPDGWAIGLLGPIYNWDEIKAGVRRCNECGAEDVETERYSFAGRCCAGCRPKMAAQHERGNWTA